ncbi:MAG: helix-turn-helix transcriptional regulator [Bacteroidales bacterium]|nr:helix-turn-helix transcriptional regulator [Bacteroidales bacterium]
MERLLVYVFFVHLHKCKSSILPTMMLDRIKQIIDSGSFTPSRFADHIGVPRSTISHILSERNKPSLEVVLRILEAFPGISSEWLLKGEGAFRGDESVTAGDTADEGVTELLNTDKNTAVMDSKTLFDEGDASVWAGKGPAGNESRSGKDQQTGHVRHVSRSAGETQTSRRSVKVIVMYDDGTYSEYFSSP